MSANVRETDSVGADTSGTDPGPDDVWTPGSRAVVSAELIAVIVAIGYIAMAIRLGIGSAAVPGAGFAPVVFGGIVVVAFGADLTRRLLGRGLTPGTGRMPRRSIVMPGAILAYAIGAPLLGHLLVAFAVVAGIVWAVGTRRWWISLVVGAVASLVTYQLFLVLGVALPSGLLGLEW